MSRVFTQEELNEIGRLCKAGKTDAQVKALKSLIKKGECPEEIGKCIENSMYDFPEEIVLDYLQTPLATRGHFIDYASKRAESGDIEAYKPFFKSAPTKEQFLECIKENFSGALAPYQKFGVAYMLISKHMLLGDECGLGKTVELCAVLSRLNTKGELKGFVICVENNAAEQWQREIVRFTGLNSAIIDSDNKDLKKLFEGTLFKEEEMENIDGIIIKHSMLKQAYATPYLDKLHELFDFNVCVLDESSVVKNAKTHSFENAKAFVKDVEYLYFLNATAFELIIDDLTAQFMLLEPGLFKNKTWVEDRFCNIRLEKIYLKGGRTRQKRHIVSYKNTDLFRSRVSYFYLARTRDELGYTRNNVCSCHLYNKTKDMIKGIRVSNGRWAEVCNCPSLCDFNTAYLGPDLVNPNDLRAFNLPMDEDHLPKLKGLYEFISEKWKAGIRQIVIYCYHVEAQNKLYEDLLMKYGKDGMTCAILSGQTKSSDKQALVDSFNSGETKVLITNVCTSLNLAAGELCIFYSVVTNPSRLLQIASRINRDTSAKAREYAVFAYRGEELSNILNAYKRSENKKRLLGDYADASTDILEVCKQAAQK